MYDTTHLPYVRATYVAIVLYVLFTPVVIDFRDGRQGRELGEIKKFTAAALIHRERTPIFADSRKGAARPR